MIILLVFFVLNLLYIRYLLSLLGASWWQGLAGMAQIAAAILAIITIRQAKKTIDQADEQRRLSVRPYWYLVPFCQWYPSDENHMNGSIKLRNTGYGPALNVTADLDAAHGSKWESTRLPSPAASAVISVEGVYDIVIRWQTESTLDAVITLTFTSRVGERCKQRFEIIAAGTGSQGYFEAVDGEPSRLGRR